MRKKLLMLIYIILTFLSIEHNFAKRDNTQAKAEINFESHTIINKFSVLIPNGWKAKTQSDTNDFFVLTNFKTEDNNAISTQSIKTEVIFISEPIDIILENHLRAIKHSQEDIIKQGNIIIDGKSAKRIWSQGTGITFPNTISSYISYGDNNTVVIHSYYYPENSLAVETIERIHWSFKNFE